MFASTTGYSGLRSLGWWHPPGRRLAGLRRVQNTTIPKVPTPVHWFTFASVPLACSMALWITGLDVGHLCDGAGAAQPCAGGNPPGSRLARTVFAPLKGPCSRSRVNTRGSHRIFHPPFFLHVLCTRTLIRRRITRPPFVLVWACQREQHALTNPRQENETEIGPTVDSSGTIT